MCFSSTGKAGNLYPDLMAMYLWNDKNRNGKNIYRVPLVSIGLRFNNEGKWAVYADTINGK